MEKEVFNEVVEIFNKFKEDSGDSEIASGLTISYFLLLSLKRG